MLRLAVPDMVSSSFFPVLAAVDLGFFHDEGVDASVELLPPPSKLFAALREGELDFVAGEASDMLSAFAGWRGAKLLAAVCQHLSFLLVVRKERGATRGDLNVVKGLRIGAAPGPDIALKRLQQRLAQVRDRFAIIMREIADRRGLSMQCDLLSHEDPVQMPEHLQDLLAATLDGLGLPYLRLPSFAGHDTNQLAKIAPVGMLFVPSRAGRSHCPEEWTEPQAVVLGARALLASLMAVDATLG